MTLTDNVVKNIIRKLLNGEDYRIEIVALINAEFLQFAIDFFKKIVDSKLNNKNITIDWYKAALLNSALPSKEIAINSGLNMKTIHNMFNSSAKSIVVDASTDHYDSLLSSIKKLTDVETDMDITLTIKLKGISVDLNINESLIIINTLAVKRSELRGGMWSTAGKRVEKPLMTTLCMLYSVDNKYYTAKFKKDGSKKFDREVDFYIKNNIDSYRCEVKLMGRGNPESADAVIARNTNIFIADTLSDQNKNQMNHLGIHWVELHTHEGYKRFKTILEKLSIPFTDFAGDLTIALTDIFKRL
jgi:hypothetical protein